MLACKAAPLPRPRSPSAGKRPIPSREISTNDPAHTALTELNVGQMFAFHKTNLDAFISPNVCSADPRPSREPGNRDRPSEPLFTLGQGSSAFFLSTEECKHLSLEVLLGSPHCWLLLFLIPGCQDWTLPFILRMLRLAWLPGPARVQESFFRTLPCSSFIFKSWPWQISLLPYAFLLWMT